MRVRRNFGQCAVLLLFVALASIWSRPADAYRYRCDFVWNEDPLPQVSPVLRLQVTSAIQRYMHLMEIREMRHRKPDLDHVKSRIRRMSEAELHDLRGILATSYDNVKALKYDPNPEFKTFKRHLDVALSELSDASGTIREVFARTGRIEDALNAYFTKVQRLTSSPIRMEADEVLFTSIRLRDRFFGSPGDGSGPIVLYGSFVNGRSYPKSSDLDFAVLDARLETRLRSTDLVSELVEFPFSEAQPHMVSPRQVHELGYLNNVIVLINRRGIEVRVYRSHLSEDFRQRQSRFDSYYF